MEIPTAEPCPDCNCFHLNQGGLGEIPDFMKKMMDIELMNNLNEIIQKRKALGIELPWLSESYNIFEKEEKVARECDSKSKSKEILSIAFKKWHQKMLFYQPSEDSRNSAIDQII